MPREGWEPRSSVGASWHQGLSTFGERFIAREPTAKALISGWRRLDVDATLRPSIPAKPRAASGSLPLSAVGALCGGTAARILGYPPDIPLGYEELERLIRPALPSDRPFFLLAESFGGPLAIRLAASRPKGLAGLILCTTFAKNPYPFWGWASSLAFLVPIKSLPRWLRALLMWGSRRPTAAGAGNAHCLVAHRR